MKPQHNVMFGHAFLDEFGGNQVLGQIELNPYLIIFDIDMQLAAVNALLIDPPYVADLVAVPCSVFDEMDLYIAIDRCCVFIACEQVTHAGPIEC